jgi:hypothetical protein
VKRRFAPIPALLATLALALPGAAAAAGGGAQTEAAGAAEQGPAKATVKIKLGKLRGGRAEIYSKVPVYGTLSPYVPGQKVEVTFYLNGRKTVRHNLPVGKGKNGTGKFRAQIRVTESGKYAAAARHRASAELRGDSTIRKSWKVSFPALSRGKCGPVVVGFKKAMRKMGYIVNSGRCFGGKTARGVLAYRKVNDLARSSRAGAGLVRKVFAGKGEYEVRHPGAGEHVEAPLAKQVLVIARGDKPIWVYPISSGKSSTPTVTGHYSFIRTEPGYNDHGMYYSWYFYGGYAVHGYESVPDYPASHGCLRTFIADQPEIYERIHYGEEIFIW